MQIGKLSNQQLRDTILSKLTSIREEVVLRPGIGEDCGGIAFGDEICVLSTDPITAANNNIGILGVHVSCNDVASSGAEPIGIMVTILAPPKTEIGDIEKVIQEIQDTAAHLNVEIIGGHTEITDAVNRIILSTTVVGKVARNKLIKSSDAEIGDDIILTKWAALEGTAILAKDFENKLTDWLTIDELNAAKKMNKKISVVQDGLIAASVGASSMHDVTEGGVYGAVWELSESSGKGVEVWPECIPLLDVTRKICTKFELDPFRLISSGSMLITCSQGDKMIKALMDNEIPAHIIGKVTKEGRYIKINGKRVTLLPPGSDEIYKLANYNTGI